MNNSTFSGNRSATRGGGIATNMGSRATLQNTIVANSPSGGDCAANLTVLRDGGYNLSSDPSCGFTDTSQSITDPKLDPLGSYGGPTQTHRLQRTSPALDAIPDANGSEPGCDGVATDQRGVDRPQDGNNDGTPSCDIGAFELEVAAQGALSINDTSVSEGNSGTTNATFTVSLSEQSTQQVTVDYATANDTATAGEDYQATSATLTFAPGTTTQTVGVSVSGDNLYEDDETFFVNLSNPKNATISDAQGIGTILTDDQDTTAPKTDIALDLPTPNGENGWYTKTVNATISAPDDSGGSGVAETRCVLDRATPPDGFGDLPSSPCAYLGSGASVSDGQHTLYAASIDKAGNTESPHSISFKIDTSAPTISDLGPTTQPNANGWYKTNVTNSFKASDSGSGLNVACQTAFPDQAGENIQSRATGGEGSAVTVTSDSCTDLAGNTATGKDSATFKIDKTAPSVSGTIPQADATKVLRATPVTANFFEKGSGIDPNTLTSASVQLFSGNSTKPVKATLKRTSNSVTLTPSSKLDANITYRAVVSTGVKDLAGNALDQDPNLADNQPKQWTFTTGAK